MSRLTAEQAGGVEMLAFLDTIAISEMGHNTNSEGKTLLEVSDDGYNVLVGSTAAHPNLFPDYSKHPARFVYLPAYGIKSSAAGRYQFLLKTWTALQEMLRLPDFGPQSQDLGAIELIRERKGLDYVHAGRIELAIIVCSQTWASLPGAGYGQHENRLGDLLSEYAKALAKYKPDFTNVLS